VVSRAATRTVGVGNSPQEIVIRPDGGVAYVSCARGGTVSVIDLESSWSIHDIPTALGADGMAWVGR
jgi:DNA-binding beta-propeller fold protein YncE